MFTQVEMDYVSSLVESMRNEGYCYYVARTVTEYNNQYDCELVFSKEKITANSQTSYTVTNGVKYQVDSSGYTIGGSYSSGNSGSRVVVSAFSGTYSFAETEFCYTNAEFTGYTLQPDLRRKGGGVYETTMATACIGALLVLFMFFALLFRR